MSLTDIGSLATAVGVAFVVVQLVFGYIQQRTAFEDAFSREYREIARLLPAEAFFDLPDSARPCPHFKEHLELYVRYFDLCNEQVFLRTQRRVSFKTWQNWSDGIRDNLCRPGFRQAWPYIYRHSHRSFAELTSLHLHFKRIDDGDEKARTTPDPAWWSPPWWRQGWKALLRLPDRPQDPRSSPQTEQDLPPSPPTQGGVA